MNLTDVKKNIVKFCIYNIALYLPVRPQIQKSSQKFWHLTPIALVQHAYGSTLRSAGYSLPNIFKCTYIYIYIYIYIFFFFFFSGIIPNKFEIGCKCYCVPKYLWLEIALDWANHKAKTQGVKKKWYNFQCIFFLEFISAIG